MAMADRYRQSLMAMVNGFDDRDLRLRADAGCLLRRRRRGLRRDRHTIRELLRAGHHHAVAGFQAFADRIVVADDRSDLDRALLRRELAAGLLGDEREELAV